MNRKLSRPPADAGKQERRASARERATALWNEGRRVESLEVLRRARLAYGPDTWLCFAYGTRAMQMGHGWSARESLHDAVELDPTNLDALEFLIEAHTKHPLPADAIDEVLGKLARKMPMRSAKDQDALAFLIPAMHESDLAVGGLRALSRCEDPVAQLASLLALSEQDAWAHVARHADERTAVRARLIVLLGQGPYEAAAETATHVSADDLPVRPLRMATRRALASSQEQQALSLLHHYLRARPEDNWARAKREELVAVKPMTHYQLTASGFPLSEPIPARQDASMSTCVLYCLHSSLPYHSVGYATRSHGLLAGIREHGWDVYGVTRLGYPYDMPGHDGLGPIDEEVKFEGVPYHRLTTTPGTEKKNPLEPYIRRYSAALSDLALQRRPFVLHAASNYWNGLAAVDAARRLGLPSIYEVRGLWEVTRGSRDPEMMGSDLFRFMARMETDAAQGATRVVAITQALKDELVRRGVESDKIDIVPNGVDTTRFQPLERNFQLAEQLGLAGKTVVGYIGSVLDYEGIDLLIEAAARLRDERDDVAFLIVGDGADLSRFRLRVEHDRLEDIVTFTGRVPHHEVEGYYSVVDICPFPRLPLPVCEMVSPLKPFEAMAMGKTVIVSDVSAQAEIVSDGETGLLHAKGDVDSLTSALRRVLDDDQLRASLARRGKAWVRAERDWTTLAGRVSDLYAELRVESPLREMQASPPQV